MIIKVEVKPSELILKPEGFNFSKLSLTKKLDAVLSTLELHSKGINDIQKILRLKIEPATLYEVRMILKKLIKDGYAEEIKSQLPDSYYTGPEELRPKDGQWIISYKLTFEAMQLIKKGGYNRKRWNNLANGWLVKEFAKLLIGAIVGYLIGWLTHR